MAETTSTARFAAKTRRSPGGCLEWIGALNRDGYGVFRESGKTLYAHRFAYETSRNEIPAGLEVDHLCRNRACVEPSHLEAVTTSTNVRRALNHTGTLNLAKVMCNQGHPFDEANTYEHPSRRTRDGLPTRSCKECMRIASRKYASKKSVEASRA